MATSLGVSFGTRKALGKRYSTDPALLLEQERLKNEYALIPTQMQKTLEDKRISMQEDQLKSQNTAGMIGAAGNLAATGMMVNAMSGRPILGKTISGLFSKAAPTTTGLTGAATNTGTSMLGVQPFAVNPSLMDGAATGLATEGAAAGATQGAGFMAGLKTAVQPYLMPASLAYGAAKLGQSLVGENTLVGKTLKTATDIVEAPFKIVTDFVSDIFGW